MAIQKKKENYLKVPNHILNCDGQLPGKEKHKVVPGARLLLAHIYSFGRKGCWESNETLSKMFYVSKRTVSLWISRLKQTELILWHNPKGYYRTLWARSHPEVKEAQSLIYNGREIPKGEVVSRQKQSTPPRKNCALTAQKLRTDCAKNTYSTAQKFPPTINTTKRDITKQTTARPVPLPAGGQAPALLIDRKKGWQQRLYQFFKKFASNNNDKKHIPTQTHDFETKRQLQIKALYSATQR